MVTRARNRSDERLLDIAPTEKGMSLRTEGCEAAIAMADATGETLEQLGEMVARLKAISEGLRAA